MNYLYGKFVKRIIDIILSLVLLIILLPVFLIVSILVRVKLGTPVIFTQERPGKNEKIFKLCKFRSMTNETDENGDLLPDEKRLTHFSRVLRSTSLDELPELINILKGDMSFIGPRPLLVRYLPFYTDEERLRHSVLPGLTGLAQVNGRNNLGWDERLAYDIQYVNEMSFANDCKIFFKTIGKVLAKKDIAVGDDLILQDLDVERRGK